MLMKEYLASNKFFYTVCASNADGVFLCKNSPKSVANSCKWEFITENQRKNGGKR